jgi:hypothetical protein
MSKVFLGVPFYARPSWAAYNTLLAAGCSASSDTCTYQGVLNYYNGQPTIRSKRTLCQNRGCKGLMAWEVSQDVSDSRSLTQAMNGGGATPRPTATARPRATARATATARSRPRATPTSSGSTCWAAWSSSTVYWGGDRASRTCGSVKENFEAAFWTQGNDPCTNRNIGGNGEEWFPRGTCN